MPRTAPLPKREREGTDTRHAYMEEDHGPDQVAAKFEQPVFLACSCCGKLIEDSTDQNASFGVEPYPHDQGFGMCFDCGGDPQSDDIRTQLGWAGRMFFETRICMVREHLTPENRAKFDTMDYEQKVTFVSRCVERGLLT